MVRSMVNPGMLLTSDGLSSFLTSVTGALTDFSTANLGTILVAGIGVAGGLVIAWFGYRFVVRKVSGAMKKGKL